MKENYRQFVFILKKVNRQYGSINKLIVDKFLLVEKLMGCSGSKVNVEHSSIVQVNKKEDTTCLKETESVTKPKRDVYSSYERVKTPKMPTKPKPIPDISPQNGAYLHTFGRERRRQKTPREIEVSKVYTNPPAEMSVVANHPDRAQLTPRPSSRMTELSRPITSYTPATITEERHFDNTSLPLRPHTNWSTVRPSNQHVFVPVNSDFIEETGSSFSGDESTGYIRTQTYHSAERSVTNIALDLETNLAFIKNPIERREARLRVICHRYRRKRPPGFLLERQRAIMERRMATQFLGFGGNSKNKVINLRHSHTDLTVAQG
jgi:hypothetical protein